MRHFEWPVELTPEERKWLSPDSPATARGVPGSDEAVRVGDRSLAQPDPATLRSQLEVLDSFHQDVASRFRDVLSRALKRLVEVRLSEVRWLAYSQFAYSRPDPTCYCVLKAAPLPVPLAMDLTPGFLFPMLDCLLGGGKRPCEVPDRPTTALEQRLARRLVRWLLDELHDAWEPLLAVEFSIERIESQAQRVRLVAPIESVVALDFEVHVAGQGGMLTLCLPYRAIRKMVDKLMVGEWHTQDASTVAPRSQPAAA